MQFNKQEANMIIDANKKTVDKIKKAINKFDPDFDSPEDFMKDVIDAVYSKKKTSRAAKILREFEDCQ